MSRDLGTKIHSSKIPSVSSIEAKSLAAACGAQQKVANRPWMTWCHQQPQGSQHQISCLRKGFGIDIFKSASSWALKLLQRTDVMELIGYLLHFIHVYDYTSLVALIINMLYGCTRGQIRLLRVGPPTCVILKSMSAWAQRSFSWPLPQARRGLFDEWAQFQQFQQKDGATKNTGGFEGRICKHLVSSFVWIWENSRFPAFVLSSHVTGSGPPSYWLKRTETQQLSHEQLRSSYSTFWISKLWGGLHG